jgi:hypothetical protein
METSAAWPSGVAAGAGGRGIGIARQRKRPRRSRLGTARLPRLRTTGAVPAGHRFFDPFAAAAAAGPLARASVVVARVAAVSASATAATVSLRPCIPVRKARSPPARIRGTT